VKGFKPTLISVIAIGLLAGSAMGAAAQNDEATVLETPLYYTWTAGRPASEIAGEFDQDAIEMRGLVVEGIPIEASDPRLSGLFYAAINGNGENSTSGAGQLESRSYRLVMDDGAWTGSGTYVVAGDPSAGGPPAIVRETMVMTGDGAYEGLVMFVTGDYRESTAGEAVILSVGVPPVPDVPDAPTE
jgi:hypothetical protein